MSWFNGHKLRGNIHKLNKEFPLGLLNYRNAGRKNAVVTNLYFQRCRQRKGCLIPLAWNVEKIQIWRQKIDWLLPIVVGKYRD